MNCEFCQSPAHVWFQCPKKPDGWRPVRLAKESTVGVGSKLSGLGDTQGQMETLGPLVTTKGTKANSAEVATGTVDTNPRAVNDGDMASPALRTSLAGVEGDKTGAKFGSEAQVDERGSPKPEDDGSRPSTSATAGSSNGRTAPFDGVNAGSTPAPASKFDKVAYQREYMRRRRAKAKADLEVQEGSK